MGRIQSSPSPSPPPPPPPFQLNQPPQMVETTSEYDLQPQEYQYDPPPPPQQEDSAAPQEEIAHTSNYESNISYTTDQNQEQAQYNFQQQVQVEQPPPQQQPFQPPPQNPQTTPNLAYQSTQPVQNPVHFHQNPPQMNNIQMHANQIPQMYANQQQPAAAFYPPQSQQPSQTSTYPLKASTQAYPPQPVQFPPQNPQAVQFPPQHGAAPANFPPPQQMQYGTQNGGQGYMPPSPHKPAAAFNGFAQGTPMHMNPMQQPVPTEAWRTGLFDCMDDPMNALVTAFFPCLTFGQIAEIIDNGHTSCGTSGLLYGLIGCLIGLPCILSCTYRTKLRGKYGLVEAPAPDWVSHFLCEWCSLCQEYRELQLRGLDPSIGWQGNVALMNQGMQLQQQGAMMPPMNQRMG